MTRKRKRAGGPVGVPKGERVWKHWHVKTEIHAVRILYCGEAPIFILREGVTDAEIERVIQALTKRKIAI